MEAWSRRSQSEPTLGHRRNVRVGNRPRGPLEEHLDMLGEDNPFPEPAVWRGAVEAHTGGGALLAQLYRTH